MKKGLKDFLTGVGSVLDISPSAHKIYRINVSLKPPKDLQSDMNVVGEDFRTIGKDLEVVLQRAFRDKKKLSKAETIARHEFILAEMNKLDLAIDRLQQIHCSSPSTEPEKAKDVVNQY